MASPRIGIWFIGARGGVAATASLGLLALQRGLTTSVGLVSELPLFERLDLADWSSFIIGGHEIRSSTLQDSIDVLHRNSRVFDAQLIDRCRPDIAAIDGRIRRGSLFGCGAAIAELAGDNRPAPESPWYAIRRLQSDLREFQGSAGVDRVVVVNLASTEPPAHQSNMPTRWDKMSPLLENAATCPLAASSLYAIAALDLGIAYINFTPSAGASPGAICDLAELRKTCHAGQDGKTGETLLKSVLTPMFAARHLEVLSWVGHNIFGNMDGQILDNPANKAAKVEGKDQLVGKILGYDPQTLVSIEYVRSLGDWKTAWDHIHFRGFLDTPMTLQFTWQGCDSLLAAPLVLDLVRFVELSQRRGEVGILSHLGSFFKRPLGLDRNDFTGQFALLENWAAAAAQ
jgi:myo-inositol-1-phosphate synthase